MPFVGCGALRSSSTNSHCTEVCLESPARSIRFSVGIASHTRQEIDNSTFSESGARWQQWMTAGRTSVLVGAIQTSGKVILLSNELLQVLESQGELQP